MTRWSPRGGCGHICRPGPGRACWCSTTRPTRTGCGRSCPRPAAPRSWSPPRTGHSPGSASRWTCQRSPGRSRCSYLRARTGLADGDGADTVAHQLGDLPLGLAQAAATISRQHLTYPQYLERLRQVPVRDLLGRHPGEDYPHATAAALLLSVQATEASDPTGLAGWLLRVLAALSPDGIPRAFLDGLPKARPGQRPALLRRRARHRREWEVDAAIERCVAGSLLEWSVTGDAVLMHRLLARVLRERDQASGQWARTVTAALNLLEPLLFPETQAWARREDGARLAAQAEALWDADAGARTSDRDLALRQLQARSWAVRQLRAAADLSRAIATGIQTLADSERVLGPDHPDTLTSRNNLAYAYQSAGRLDQAIPLYEQTLADRERVLGADHPDTLTSRNNLAGAYRVGGPPGPGDPAVRADPGRPRTGAGPRPPRHAHLAEQPRGRLPRRRAAWARRSRCTSRPWPTANGCWAPTTPTRSPRGTTSRTPTRRRAAWARRSRCTSRPWPTASGSWAPTTPTRSPRGTTSRTPTRRRAAWSQAIPLYEQTLADRERVLGPDHPDTLTSRNNLAYAYQAAGRLEQAIPLYEQTLADRERVLGPDHPDTLSSRNNLADAYQAAGRLEQAIPLYEQTLADSERVLGPDHPDTLTSRNNLADAYRAAGRLEQAIPLYEQTLADRERVLGPDHPQTLTSRNNLAGAYQAAGRLEQAIPLYEQTLADRERVLGPDHPHTLTSRNNLAYAYQEAGRLEQAIPLYEQTLADRERVLGADHPDTLTSRNKLERARIEDPSD